MTAPPFIRLVALGPLSGIAGQGGPSAKRWVGDGGHGPWRPDPRRHDS
jgi:hypothetical protein